jgi:hypothetical protein
MTTVIQDKLSSASDDGILRSLGLTEATLGVVWSEHPLISVHNEHGAGYQAIGPDRSGKLFCLLRKLCSLGYEAACTGRIRREATALRHRSQPAGANPDEAVPPAMAVCRLGRRH